MRIAFALTIFLIAGACAHVGREGSNALVGQWRYADAIQSCHYVFKRDGSFSGEVVYKGKKVSQFQGKWFVEADHLFYDYTGDVLGTIAAGSQDNDKLVVVAENYFVIEARDGSKRRYNRIQ